jgi:NodT family efflux transporter outer membrane factor (OMF) lipoprotein
MIALASAALSACSIGPDYTPPEARLPDAWQTALEQPKLPEDNTLKEYWKGLKDPTLDKLIARALDSNLDIEQSLLRLDESFSLYRIERAGFFPDLDGVTTYQRRRRSRGIASAISEPSDNLFSIGGVLAWEIDVLGRVRRLTEAARAEIEASVEDYHATRITLIAEVALSYARICTIKSQIASTLENIRSQQDSLTLAQDRFRVGIAPELDVRQAESNLGTTEAALPELRIALNLEKHRLAVLLGGFPEDSSDIIEQLGVLPEISDFEFANLPVNILRQRPDVRRIERSLAAQHARIGARKAELFPIVSLPGTFSFEALNSVHNAFNKNSLAFSIGPSIRWNIFDMGATLNAVDVERLRTEQLRVEYQKTVLQAVQEVEDASISLREQKLRAISLRKSVLASKKAVVLVRSLYLSGLTDFQNVLDSERRLFTQEISEANSRGLVVEAYISLFRALGGGWSLKNSYDS